MSREKYLPAITKLLSRAVGKVLITKSIILLKDSHRKAQVTCAFLCGLISDPRPRNTEVKTLEKK